MSTYRPEKRAHRVLQRLTRGAETFAGLLDLFAFDSRGNMRTKLHLILNALRDDGFVEHGFMAYRITDQGWDALVELDAGQVVCSAAPAPTVRIFAIERRQAA